MAVNSPETTLFSVIFWFVWFSTIFDEYIASFEFFIFVVVVIVAFMVVGNRHSGTDGYVVIPLGNLVRLGNRMSSRVGVSWAVSVDADSGGGEEEVQNLLANWSITSAN